MTIDFLHLYCKCPHCTTMFRAAVSDIDASEGWAKCGHCRKVFDCRTNEIKPEDFVSAGEPGEDDSVEQTPGTGSGPSAENSETDDFMPQISIFDDSEQPNVPGLERSGEIGMTDSDVENQNPGGRDNKTAEPDNTAEDKWPSVENYTADPQSGHADKAPDRSQNGSSSRLQPTPEQLPRADRQVVTGQLSTLNNQRLERPRSNSRLNITKPQAAGFSEIITAKAQSWKKQRNRFKKTKTFPFTLIAVALFALLIWQIAIANYSKLLQYRFLSAPLMAVCSIVTCNDAIAPENSGFEILHASVRRHTSMPNVMSVSAKLINFSDENKIMPTLRLDLTDDNNIVIASRTIELTENPQFSVPALTELAPGQDVQLVFNINHPDKFARGFQLNLVNHQE